MIVKLFFKRLRLNITKTHKAKTWNLTLIVIFVPNMN
jgi:hypothetical protein